MNKSQDGPKYKLSAVSESSELLTDVITIFSHTKKDFLNS